MNGVNTLQYLYEIKNIINNKKAIAVLTINTAIAFYYSFSLGLAVTDIHSAFT